MVDTMHIIYGTCYLEFQEMMVEIQVCQSDQKVPSLHIGASSEAMLT